MHSGRGESDTAVRSSGSRARLTQGCCICKVIPCKNSFVSTEDLRRPRDHNVAAALRMTGGVLGSDTAQKI